MTSDPLGELVLTFIEGRLVRMTAPQRERARQAAVAAALKEREEKTRLANKANFKP